MALENIPADAMVNLVIKFQLGEATDAEAGLVADWAAQNQKNCAYHGEVEKLLALYDKLQLPASNTHDAWLRLNPRLVRKTAAKLSRMYWLAAASVFLFAIGYWMIPAQKKSSNDTVDTRMITLRADGNASTVTLPDSSILIIQPGGSVTYPSPFDQGERVVSMTGSVFFDVKHQQRRPFRVKVGDIVVTDIGTSFHIIQTHLQTVVAVVGGEVQVTRGSLSVLLAAGERTSIRPGDTAIIKQSNITFRTDTIEPGRPKTKALFYKSLPEDPLQQKKIVRLILKDIGLTAVQSFALNDSVFTVNDVRQPSELHRKLKTRYLRAPGYGVYYGSPSVTGKGIFFTASELNQ